MHASSVLVALSALASTAYATPQRQSLFTSFSMTTPPVASDTAVNSLIPSSLPSVTVPSGTGISTPGVILPSSMPPFPFPVGNSSVPGSTGLGTVTQSPITISNTVLSTVTPTTTINNGGATSTGSGSGSSTGSARPSHSSGAASSLQAAGGMLGMGVAAAFFL